MALDGLYGPGAEAGLLAALERAWNGVSLDHKRDGVRGECYVSGVWSPSVYVSMVCSAERVHYTGIGGPASFYRKLRDELPGFFRGLGVIWFTATARDQTSKTQLMANAVGTEFQPKTPGSLELWWDIRA